MLLEGFLHLRLKCNCALGLLHFLVAQYPFIYSLVQFNECMMKNISSFIFLKFLFKEIGTFVRGIIGQ
jgi:hypothetical protein